jgi:hypothetical protein
LIAKDGFVEYTPPRVFFHKSSDFLDYKGVGVFGMAKEFATVSRERIYVEECAEGVELTHVSLPER